MRYDNFEVYHSTPYGLALKQILAQPESLTEKLPRGLRLAVAELFGTQRRGSAGAGDSAHSKPPR